MNLPELIYCSMKEDMNKSQSPVKLIPSQCLFCPNNRTNLFLFKINTYRIKITSFFFKASNPHICEVGTIKYFCKKYDKINANC